MERRKERKVLNRADSSFARLIIRVIDKYKPTRTAIKQRRGKLIKKLAQIL